MTTRSKMNPDDVRKIASEDAVIESKRSDFIKQLAGIVVAEQKYQQSFDGDFEEAKKCYDTAQALKLKFIADYAPK